MRAKVVLNSVHRFKDSEQLSFSAVTNGTPEDNTYSKFTPAATFSLTVTNPDLLGKYEPGKKYYVDFTPAE